LTAVLAVFIAGFLLIHSRQEADYTQDYVDSAFLSAQRVFDSALRINTDKLSATLTAIAQDEVLQRAMIAGDRPALLRRAAPFLDSLREEYGITHFYFMRPDLGVFLRAHQPNRHGDVINRHTATQAKETGKLAAGLELGPLGTFTLRTVIPWRDGDHLIGYLELGEEIGHVLAALRENLGLDIFLTIQKRHLSQQDWTQGNDMLNRQAQWDFLPNSVVVFQSMKSASTPFHQALSKEDFLTPTGIDISDDGRKFRVGTRPLNDSGGRTVGGLVFLRDVTARNTDSKREIMLASATYFGLSGALFWIFYLVIGQVEKRLTSSREKITESEARFRGLVESSSDWIWEIDAQDRYVYASPKVKCLLGYEPAEVLGKTPFDFMPQEEAVRVSRSFAGIAAERKPFEALENVNLHKDGRLVVLETSGVPVLDDLGNLLGYRGVDRDITVRKRTAQLIEESTQRLALHFQQTPLAIIEWDLDFRVVDWNPAAAHVFGYSKAQAIGRHAVDLILPDSEKLHVAKIWDALLTGNDGFRSSNENRTQDGKAIYCEWYNTPLKGADGRVIGVSSLVQDVTEQKRTAERINHLAYYDDLTGLPNRMLFKDRLSHACIEAGRKDRLVGVMFLDVDHFKDVNDTLGHEAGDILLHTAAQRLQGCMRASDTVARFGGDEFAVIFSDVGHVDAVTQVAQHVVDGFKESFDIHGRKLFVTISMGITLYPLDDGDIEALMRNADSAMYAAKAAGRNCYRFYDAAMTERVTERLALQSGLHRALDYGEFTLHYQPQLDIESHRISGVEALVRWQHPERGMVSPAQFIPVAEETGLIVPLGDWILRTACQQAKAWQDQGLPQMCMAVNLSARQFKDPLFQQRVLEILKETGLDPRYLELEITESILVDGLESVKTTLQAFKRTGIAISLDDFGTGYSSLSYLKQFPIDKLKIDQSFVRDALTDANDASLVRAIIAMAHALGLRTIAEGVETQAQLEFLRAEGCDEIQGYHLAKPLPAQQLPNLILHYNAILPLHGH
jgi:diguanylate cyclase (GGDEF)-like protein/PAS domain S-box-containing protein